MKLLSRGALRYVGYVDALTLSVFICDLRNYTRPAFYLIENHLCFIVASNSSLA